jgi:N-acetyl-D-muramate 6-phosphate phosphatase
VPEPRIAPAPAAPLALPLPVDAVLFDLDGTLADTAPDLAAALNRVRVDLGLAPLPFARLRPHASHGARGLIGAGFGYAPDDAEFAALRDAFLAHYESALCVDSTLFPGVDLMLDAVEARGLRWGIVTNKVTRFTLPLVADLKLAPRAGAIVCGDTTSHAKPHPAPLLHAARTLGVAPERCVYVGDAARDIEAGRAAGMRTLVASYGYLGDADMPDAWRADGAVATPHELVSWLPDRR